MSVFVTVSARTYEELMWRKQQMTDMLKSMDMYVSDCSFQQEDALRTVMPFLQISPKLEKKSKRNVLTSGAASTYAVCLLRHSTVRPLEGAAEAAELNQKALFSTQEMTPEQRKQVDSFAVRVLDACKGSWTTWEKIRYRLWNCLY